MSLAAASRWPFIVRPIKARALAGAALLGAVACGGPTHGLLMDPPEPAAPLVLANPAGGRFDLSTERGAVVLVYFGYTHCPDVCPTTLSEWARAKRALGERGAKVRWVFVSVDPGRDTPEVARAYAQQFDSSFVGLVAGEAELERLKADWHFAAYPEGDPRQRDYSVAHPARTYVVDPKGRLHVLYDPGVRSDDLAEDLRKLL